MARGTDRTSAVSLPVRGSSHTKGSNRLVARRGGARSGEERWRRKGEAEEDEDEDRDGQGWEMMILDRMRIYSAVYRNRMKRKGKRWEDKRVRLQRMGMRMGMD